MKKPLLSICLPSFNHPIGTKRILTFLSQYNKNDIEIIVADNSTNSSIKKLSKIYKQNLHLIYKHNFPVLPPINNWNYSISLASGKYIMLLHHDEHFTIKDFKKLMFELRNNNKTDVFITNVVLFNRKKNKFFNHLPIFLKKFLLSYFKFYIYIKNFIGPTGCIVFNRKLFLPFKDSLVWTVDQDWYKKIIFNRTKFLCHISVISDYSRNDSLTQYIGFKKYYLRIKEDLKFFKFIYPFILLIKIIDLFFWIPFRLIYNYIRK